MFTSRMSILWIYYLVAAILIIALLIILAVLLYKLLFKKVHYLYSLLLLAYPILIYFSGHYLISKGRDLNAADWDARMDAGESIPLLSVDAGLNHIFSGYIFYIAIIPISFICVFLFIKRILIKTEWI